MKKETDKEVRIPQLHKVRKVYIENGKEYILMDNIWYELEEYKRYMKETFAINISYDIAGELWN